MMSEISRLRFLKLLGTGAALAPLLSAWGESFENLRGDRVGWARLKTPSQWWKRHAAGDPVLMKFFRDETTLNIDPVWYAAEVNNLAELCRYPFLFSQGVGMVSDPASRSHLAEYIRRGGFLLIDACHAPSVTPDFDEFLRQQNEFFAAALPEARIEPLPATHNIFRCRFEIPEGRPPHTFNGNAYDARKARHGLYGLMIGARLAGVIGVCGWQCGWDHVTEHRSTAPPGTDVACMKMLVNVYVYAMTQGG
jgi:Domain of unknown function (DUF4159)